MHHKQHPTIEHNVFNEEVGHTTPLINIPLIEIYTYIGYTTNCVYRMQLNYLGESPLYPSPV